MNAQMAVHLVTETLMTAFWVCAPILAVSFVVGIVINLIQIVTSLQDQAFSTIPRLTACLGAILLLLPWMISHATAFTLELFRNLALYAR